MPDWKSADAYSFAGRRTREDWAWEFMRRNPSYQLDYERDKRARGDRKANRAAQGPTGSGGSNSRAFTSSASLRLGWKWGLRGGIQAPATDQAPSFMPRHVQQVDPNEIDRWVVPVRERHADHNQIRPGFVLIAFTLDSPVSVQLRVAKGLLKSAQGRMRHVRNKRIEGVRTWRRYLRLLDAIAAKATQREIAEGIYLDGRPWAALDADRRNYFGKIMARDRIMAKQLLLRPQQILF